MNLQSVPWSDGKIVKVIKRELSLGSPRKAEVIAFGEAGKCYWNCDRYIEENGGKIVYGWLLLEMPGLFYVLEHHGIVKRSTGELIDPTRFDEAVGGQTVIYVDNRIEPSRDYPPYISNRYHPQSGGGHAMAVFQAAEDVNLDVYRRLAAEAKRQAIPWSLGRNLRNLQPSLEAQEIGKLAMIGRKMTKDALALCRDEAFKLGKAF